MFETLEEAVTATSSSGLPAWAVAIIAILSTPIVAGFIREATKWLALKNMNRLKKPKKTKSKKKESTNVEAK